MFRLTYDEYKILRCQNGALELNQGQYSKYSPYVFTEYGITMLAGVLKSDIAINASLKIVETFIKMRKYIVNNKYNNEILINHEKRLLKIENTLDTMNEKKKVNEVFFKGQIYDAYSKIIDIFNESKKELIIVDCYADKTILDMIRKISIQVTLIVKDNKLLKKLDIKKYNEQYNNLKVIYDDSFHDRYFIIDCNKIYHCGTSVNYAGSRTFSINVLEDELIKTNLINKIITILY